MTNDETRDALAEMDGLNNINGKWYGSQPWPNHGYDIDELYPPTLDGADAAMPEGWTWGRMHDIDDGGIWTALRVVSEGVWVDERSVPDTGNKIADLYALALACRRAVNPLYTPPTNGGTNPTT